jgi:hypothetical protein
MCAVTTYTRAFIRASLNGTFLEFCTTSDRRKQIGSATLTSHTKRVTSYSDDPCSSLISGDSGYSCTRAVRKTFYTATLKACATHASAIDARAVRSRSVGATAENSIIVCASTCNASQRCADTLYAESVTTETTQGVAFKGLNVQSVQA